MKLLLVTILCIVAATTNAKRVRPDTFIVGGQNSENVPFYVYLEIFDFSNFTGPMYFGGGTLITTTHVLTVAQNVFGFNSWRCGLGSNRIYLMQWRDSARAEVYPDYDPENLSHNVAVIRLNEPTPINNKITPIQFFTSSVNNPGVGSLIVVNGFGFGGGEQNQQPDVLQTLTLAVISQTDCGFEYPHLHTTSLLSNHFCARKTQISQSNICAGDQGGPAYWRSSSNYTLVGIQSFYRKANCSLEDAQPGAFIRYSSYRNWITNQTNSPA